GLDTFDTPAKQLFAQALFAEAGDADDALLGGRTFGEPRQRRSHLAAHPEDNEVAVDLAEFGNNGGRRRRHYLFKLLDIVKMRRQDRLRMRHGTFLHEGGDPGLSTL